MVTMMKTPVTVLQEMMTKLNMTPEYECIAQSGPMHQASFEYRCVALGVVVTATARSKKEAKQEAARLMLQQLSIQGHDVPPPYGRAGGGRGGGGGGIAGLGARARVAPPAPEGGGAAAGDGRSYVALMKELCEEYKLPAVQYELVGDTGPPHLRRFTFKARMGLHERMATNTTKKAARQHAAEQLYSFLRENLARVTEDFDESEALVRAREKAMERFIESRDEPSWRPDLSQKISEYHLGIVTQIESDLVAAARRALQAAREESPERSLGAAAAALGLAVEAAAGGDEVGVAVLALSPASPELAFAGSTPSEAAATALRYLRRALAQTPPTTDPHPHPHPVSLLD